MSYVGNRRRRARRGMHGMGATAIEYALLQANTTGIQPSKPVVLPANPPTPPQKLMVGAHALAPRPWHGVARYGMSGLSSRPPGARIARGAMGDGPPKWYQAMYGVSGLGSLGDDAVTAPAATPVLTDGTAQWQSAMLANSNQILSTQQAFITKDQIARYVQVAATLSIPLAAALWRIIFKSGGRSGTE